MDFYLIGKLVLILYVWFFIFACLFFLVKSRKFYSRLTNLEIIFKDARKESVRKFLPELLKISEQNQVLQMLLGIKEPCLKTILFSVSPYFFGNVNFFRGIKTGFNLMRRIT